MQGMNQMTLPRDRLRTGLNFKLNSKSSLEQNVDLKLDGFSVSMSIVDCRFVRPRIISPGSARRPHFGPGAIAFKFAPF